jgi:hypothetical protein
MTGMPNAVSNRLSVAAGSGAEADRVKRTRSGARPARGSIASTAMIAGTALIQVIRCCSISAQNPRRLNLRSRTRQARAASVASNPTTSALTWNSGRQQ